MNQLNINKRLKIMKKLILFVIFGIALLFTACNDSRDYSDNHSQKVECYKQFDNTTNSWMWYYVMFGSHGNNYYYHNSYPISSYSNVNWSNSDNTFNQSTATSLGETYVPSSGFSEDMQSNFTESNGFESSSSGYTESNGFSNESSSSDNTSVSTESESGGFGGSEDSGGSSDSGGGE